MPGSITHKRLADATRSRHQQLDQHVALLGLLSVKPVVADYVRAMQSFYQCFYILEPVVAKYESANVVTGLGPYVRNLHALAEDLHALNVVGNASLVNIQVPRIETTAEYIGVRYVLEGSAQGGAYIAAHLQDKLPEMNSAFSYWVLQRHTAQNWTDFLSFVSHLDSDNQQQQHAVQSAQQTFDIFLTVFDTVNHGR